MRKVVSLMHLSLDGYVEGPNAEMDWINIEEPVFAFVDRFIPQVGTALYGPKTFAMMEAYWPSMLSDETATAVAEKHGLKPADVLVGYLVAKNIVTLPKSVTPARIKANIDGALAAAKKLTPEDIEKLDGVAASGKQVRLIQPPWGVDLGFEDWPVKFPS